MADNRADTRARMRTPLARVKGLGASGHGAEHWWLQRLTAVANIPLHRRLRDHRRQSRRPLLRRGGRASCPIPSSRSCSSSR